ncbi:hypothetical protein PUNSTDRAFT_72486, partial [Punctularia strigosozonata HHB-11173 SS5]|uniref:uncharacterized protein n=1 Tax=Punctularia strigosozonata (strain HHB-11173) TaxID=741275 RepID=UPI00044170A2
YLRSRCLLCFGGSNFEATRPQRCKDDVNVIVCLDACFTQKRRASGRRDPAKTHPASVFLPEDEVKAMELEVEQKRGNRASRSKSKRKGAPARDRQGGEEEEDRCEGPLTVPNSVLDGCEESFKATDEQREKASTKFFDDTGVMAILC